MKNYRKISKDLFYVGVNDRRLELFENLFPIPNGVSYNSYILKDDKNVLFDTVDKSAYQAFADNIDGLLGEGKLDYIIINHMEPDHAATLQDIIEKYPEAKIVGNSKTINIIRQFFNFDFEPITVGEGDSIETGHHKLAFYMMPMVHWPETMMTFDETDGTLFTADAFGTFGAVDGNLFADEFDFDAVWQNEARRYYTNIVGKYGVQVQAALKKAQTLDIKTICPLHGPIWRNDFSWMMKQYDKWSKWEAECDDILVVYGSMYGNTENAAQIVAAKLSEMGKKVTAINLCNTDVSYAISEIFRVNNVVFAAPTYNGGIYPPMNELLNDMKALGLRSRNVGIIENGTWAPMIVKQMTAFFETMKDINIKSTLTIKSSLKENQSAQIDEFCNGLI